MLADHKDETLPLLFGAFPRYDSNEIPFGRVYALGLTQAPEAIEALKDQIKQRKNYYALRDLVYALGVAGEAGENALRELATTAGDNLKLVIERNPRRKSPWERPKRMPYPFPEVPSGIRLPTSCVQHDGRTGYVCDKERSDGEN